MNNTYIENGLLLFSKLKGDRLQIATTYENSIWGNMNPYYSKTQEDIHRIEKNDKKIADIMGVKTSFVFTTPNEPTVIDLDSKVVKYLEETTKDEDGYKYVTVRANAGIIYPQSKKYSYIIAPADCPVVIVVPKDRTFIVIMHLGAPQLAQRIQNTMSNLLGNKFKDTELDGATVFLTPYVCKDHYSVNVKKYQLYKDALGDVLDKYTEVKYHDVYKEDSYFIDFVSLIKDHLKDIWNVTTVIDSNVCTYESTKEGFLFSHAFVKELERRKEDGEVVDIDIAKGSYNVIISF